MSLKTEAIKRFLTAARSLANQGLSREAIMQFAKNEFGEITELFKRQIDNIFKKPASGIEKIKIKDEIFDDTVTIQDQRIRYHGQSPFARPGACDRRAVAVFRSTRFAAPPSTRRCESRRRPRASAKDQENLSDGLAYANAPNPPWL